MGQIVTLNGRPLECEREPYLAVGVPPRWTTPVEINSRMVHGVNINGYDYPPCPTGTVLHYPGLPGQGALIWDRSNFVNHGTIVGATWRRRPSGIYELRYDGNDYINIDVALNDLAATTKGTWMTWVKLDDATPATSSYIIAFGDTDVIEAIEIRVNAAGTIYAEALVATVLQWGLVTNAAAIFDRMLAHVALIQDGAAPVILINGIQVAQTMTVSTDTTIWFSGCAGLDNGRIGCRNIGGGGNLFFWTNGNTALTKIINTNLTVAQVRRIVEEERPLVTGG